MDRAERLSHQRQLENEHLRAKLVREIQEFSHRLSEVELSSGPVGDVSVQKVLVNSYQEMIEARRELLGLMPSPVCEARRTA